MLGQTRSQGIPEMELQEALRARSKVLYSYVDSKIPTKLRRVVAADDLLQDVYIAAFRGIDDFRPDGPDALDRWLTTICQHVMLNAIKSSARTKRGGDAFYAHGQFERESSYLNLLAEVMSPGCTPSSEAATAEAVAVVEIALASLPEPRRQAISLRFLGGKEPGEVAREMNKTKAAVNSLLFHGLQQLREKLGRASKYLPGGGSSA